MRWSGYDTSGEESLVCLRGHCQESSLATRCRCDYHDDEHDIHHDHDGSQNDHLHIHHNNGTRTRLLWHA